MYKILYLFVAVAFFSCASSRIAVQPDGEWNYKITGTPSGDFSGLFVVTKNGDKYSASLNAAQNEIKFDEVDYVKETKKLTGSFYYEGNRIDFESTMDGDELKGWVSAGGESWPFSGTRKK